MEPKAVLCIWRKKGHDLKYDTLEQACDQENWVEREARWVKIVGVPFGEGWKSQEDENQRAEDEQVRRFLEL